MAKASKERWHWTWAQGKGFSASIHDVTALKLTRENLLADLSIGVKLKETTQREIDE
ncbi:MAG: hypothetical protein P8P54_17995 [Pseudomonadales bacterium]|nr:hypothetical protein [Gammaproteobacteria bacterium]MDB3989444.1 hypothetical protein [Pseudomonadales bacterium]MBT3901198.1 hypothetical protein [Gammaproteobacteria bacterium]MDC0939787.1 hypothetical protein [Pseudomonadales bacterium]MDG1002246.1 hypothetical protein [Pseudomonadales bacterium]